MFDQFYLFFIVEYFLVNRWDLLVCQCFYVIDEYFFSVIKFIIDEIFIKKILQKCRWLKIKKKLFDKLVKVNGVCNLGFII